MLPPQYIFQNIKNRNEILSLKSQYSMCIWEKLTFFMSCVKKLSRNQLFLTLIFFSFYTLDKKYRFFQERLCEHLEYQMCTVIFLFNIVIFERRGSLAQW
jgi:hypothetical protein